MDPKLFDLGAVRAFPRIIKILRGFHFSIAGDTEVYVPNTYDLVTSLSSTGYVIINRIYPIPQNTDRYLKTQAKQDVKRPICRAFAATKPNNPKAVMGYYTLGTLSIELN